MLRVVTIDQRVAPVNIRTGRFNNQCSRCYLRKCRGGYLQVRKFTVLNTGMQCPHIIFTRRPADGLVSFRSKSMKDVYAGPVIVGDGGSNRNRFVRSSSCTSSRALKTQTCFAPVRLLSQACVSLQGFPVRMKGHVETPLYMHSWRFHELN